MACLQIDYRQRLYIEVLNNDMTTKNYCVIMGGGIGSRFWPMSRERRPKQFLDIFGTGRSLLQMTYDRFASFIPRENIIVVTGEMYKAQVLEQLPELRPSQVLCEPMRRNTAPCIAYACYHIMARCPDANIIVSPSDHLILNEVSFVESLKRSLLYVEQHDQLVTLGVRPSRPETGYGYIQMEAGGHAGSDDFCKVKTFTEKPDKALAEVFVSSGEFLWNSGMFVWNIRTIMTALERYLPDLCDLLAQGREVYATEQEYAFIQDFFPRCPSISIDYGVMEKAENVTVLPVDFGWADLGTWGSVYDLKDKDEQDNVTLGTNARYYESRGNIVSMDNADGLVVLQGIDDCIVAQSDGVLLICKRDQEQRIKDFTSKASHEFAKRYD